MHASIGTANDQGGIAQNCRRGIGITLLVVFYVIEDYPTKILFSGFLFKDDERNA